VDRGCDATGAATDRCYSPPEQIQAILDGCAVYEAESGSWREPPWVRFVFALLAETGSRRGEAPHPQVVPILSAAASESETVCPPSNTLRSSPSARAEPYQIHIGWHSQTEFFFNQSGTLVNAKDYPYQ
jgi:hypothetical protein